MKKFGLALFAVLVVLCSADFALADNSFSLGGAPIGAGVVMIGAAFGFAKIGSAALEGMARQPEAAGKIQPAMIVIAALLEGATFFALLVCMVAK